MNTKPSRLSRKKIQFETENGHQRISITLHYSSNGNPIKADIATSDRSSPQQTRCLAKGLNVESGAPHGFLRIRDDGSLSGLPYAHGQIVMKQVLGSYRYELHPIGCGAKLSGVLHQYR